MWLSAPAGPCVTNSRVTALYSAMCVPLRLGLYSAGVDSGHNALGERHQKGASLVTSDGLPEPVPHRAQSRGQSTAHTQTMRKIQTR